MFDYLSGARGVSHLSAVALVLALLCAAHQAEGGVGATTPFISVEAESGYLGAGASVVSLVAAPSTEYSSPQLEASGHAYVQLTTTGQYVQWTNDTGQNITAINLRSCIPDAPGGGGIVSFINLYVDGVFRQSLSVNSQQNYCYEGTNYDGQTDKNPADGDPRGFWNDTHALISGAAVAPGSALRLQKDATNSATFYYIDVVDLENPPPPLTQPTNSLSIASYGAMAGNASVDNTSSMNRCFSACLSEHKIAWIPAGTFYIGALSGGLSASGITIAGAGPWYSTIYRVTPANNPYGIANIINATSCALENVLLDCNSSSRAGNNNNGAVDFSGTNWVVSNVWIQHVTSSFWCAGVNGIAENCRTLSTWADGGNFNNVQSANGIGMNLIYSNNFVRGTGDDAMAINSVRENVYGTTTNYYTTMSNITYVNNSSVAPWGGKGLGIYGGINVVVANNLLTDSPRYLGLGVMKFGVNGSDLFSARVIGNTLLRCGANGYNQQQQGMMIGNGGDGQGVGTIENAYIASNTIIDAQYDGVGFSTSTNIVLEYNTIINPGLDGFVPGAPDLGSWVTGSAVLNFNSVIGLNPGYSGYDDLAGGYLIGGIGNKGFTVPGPLPGSWLSEDIGPVATAGGASYDKDTFTIVGSGADIGGTNDEFHYVYQPASGNCGISARVATEEIVNASAKAGIMIRNSLDPADMEASVLATPGHGLVFQWRDAYGGATLSNAVAQAAVPCWVQLSRSGNAFTASYSSNGTIWITIGTTQTIPMATNVLVGMAIASHTNCALCSAMLDHVAAITPAQAFAAAHWEGDLVINLQSSDLSATGKVWTNRTTSAATVGNFATTGGGMLNVATVAWNSQSVKTLFVDDTLAHAVQSALEVPAEIIGNSPVSAEAWIFATAVSQQNSCAMGYGLQGGPSAPEEDREFNYSDPCCGGGVSGDFGSFDTSWTTTPAPGTWHYLAWTYDGGTVSLYLDGVLNASNNPSDPLATPATVVGVGAGIANSGPNLGADAFQGYIAAVRLESGVLSASDIATNFALGPLASAAALAPGGLAAVAGSGQVVLTWNPPGNASSYDVSRSSNSNGTYTLIATNIASLGFTNTGLSNGMVYYFVVSAVNAAGESPHSAPVSAQPTSPTPPQLGFEHPLNGAQFQLAWPADHTGWSLQAATNLSNQGLGPIWTTMTASTFTNQITVPIGLTNESVFFRLVYPR